MSNSQVNQNNPHTQELSSYLCFDEDGFMVDPSVWTEEAALFIAKVDGIGTLHEEHWQVIRFLRDRYLRLGAIPPMRHICRSSMMTRKDINRLFGSCAQIWRIAGLPNPGEEAKSYMN
ncbi:MAG: TusE/DsrC/DsvC family sulfur relay protein [Gammaproteobacteria bacterium]|nr:TusE/DsrC/DsvC family sulfur relay protein [Gammaproteobacteria bacterium]